jgi:hypothetical protein
MAKIAGQNIPDIVLLGGAALFAAWFLSPGGITTLEHYGLAGEVADITPQRPPRNPPPSGSPPPGPPPTGGGGGPPPRPRPGPGGQPGPWPRPPPGGHPGPFPGPRQPPDWRVPRPEPRRRFPTPPRFHFPSFNFPRFPWLALPQSNISYEQCVWAGEQVGKDLSECCADAYDLGRNIHLFEVENCLSCGRRDC